MDELEAQWQRCVDNGVRPSHLDSHQHVHNIWPIGEIVARFAARQGVAVRLARNLGQNLSLPKRVFKSLLNRRLQNLSGATADYVCTPVDLRNAPCRPTVCWKSSLIRTSSERISAMRI